MIVLMEVNFRQAYPASMEPFFGRPSLRQFVNPLASGQPLLVHFL